MADVEGGLVSRWPTVLLKHSLDLKGTHALLALANEIDDLEPDRQWIVRVLKHCADERGEAIAVLLVAYRDEAGVLVHAFLAALADPSPVTTRDSEYLFVAATRTAHAIRPAHRDKQFHALFLGLVLFVNLSKAQHEQTYTQFVRGVKSVILAPCAGNTRPAEPRDFSK